MDAQKRKALVKAYGYIIDQGATVPEDTDAAMTRLGIKTAAYYEQVITRLVKTLYHGDIDLLQFTQIFGDLVQAQLTKAWAEGMQVNGLDPKDDMTEEWQAQLDQIIVEEKTNILDFAEEIHKASGLTGEPLDQYLARVDMWSNRYDDVVNQATVATAGDGKLKWVYGETEHCPECEQLNGVVAFASEWKRAQVYPQQPPNDALTCGGWRCQCHMEPTTERRSPNALDKIIAIAMGPSGKSAKAAKVHPQLADDPKDANADWLKDNDPRIALFAKGKDPDGKPMKAYIVDGRQIRMNVWQDWCEGGNHSRYPWNPKNEYWLGESHIDELEYSLVHL